MMSPGKLERRTQLFYVVVFVEAARIFGDFFFTEVTQLGWRVVCGFTRILARALCGLFYPCLIFFLLRSVLLYFEFCFISSLYL